VVVEPPNNDPPVDAVLPNRPPGLAALLSLAAVLPNIEPDVPEEPNMPVLPDDDAGVVLDPKRGAAPLLAGVPNPKGVGAGLEEELWPNRGVELVVLPTPVVDPNPPNAEVELVVAACAPNRGAEPLAGV